MLPTTIRDLWARPGTTAERTPLSDRRSGASGMETCPATTRVESAALLASRVGRFGSPLLRRTMTELRAPGGTSC